MRQAIIRDYYQEPTLAAFHADDSFVRGIRGPFGSGKSVSCCMEILMRSARQPIGPGNRRRSRWAVIRNTFGELRSTTIKTWQEWVPDSVCPIVYDSPIRGNLVSRSDDGSLIDLEVLFVALDRPQDVKKLLSLELTGAWINEARETPKAILDALTGRVGRFPSKAMGGCAWSGIILDTNPPDTDHWWFHMAEEERPVGYQFFKQPPALLWDSEHSSWCFNPMAENVRNQPLGSTYWLRQVASKTREWILVYLCGEYGSVLDGKVVYPEYNDDIHHSDVEPILMPDQRLVLGFDFGLTPACIFGQFTPRGRLVIIDEACAIDMGIQQFLRDVVVPRLKSDFSAAKRLLTVGDPAGTGRAQTDESTCFDMLRAVGLDPIPACTNSFLPRREAVAGFLNKLVDGRPGFLLGPKAVKLRKGFLGGYCYHRLQVSGREMYRDEPEKNEFSHPHDGLQYLALAYAEAIRDDASSQTNWALEAQIPIAGSM